MPGPRQRHRLHALAGRLALRRPRAHPPLPVGVIAVADDERERRAERPPVAQAGEHLDRVLLELLPRAAPVALLAAREVGVDRLPVEHEARGQPADDRHERGPVRLACGGQRERHEPKPKALRIASTGAGRPVQSCERRRALADERLVAVHDLAPSRPRGGDERGRPAVGAVGEVDDRLPRARLDEQLVAHRRRVHDQVGVRGVRRPFAAAREHPHLARQAGQQRLGGPAGADQADALGLDPGHDLLVGVEAEHAPVAEDERVDRLALGLVAELGRRLLVRDRHVRAGPAAPHGRLELVRLDLERDVLPVEPGRGEGGVLHPRRERLGHGLAEQRDARAPHP